MVQTLQNLVSTFQKNTWQGIFETNTYCITKVNKHTRSCTPKYLLHSSQSNQMCSYSNAHVNPNSSSDCTCANFLAPSGVKATAHQCG